MNKKGKWKKKKNERTDKTEEKKKKKVRKLKEIKEREKITDKTQIEHCLVSWLKYVSSKSVVI